MDKTAILRRDVVPPLRKMADDPGLGNVHYADTVPRYLLRLAADEIEALRAVKDEVMAEITSGHLGAPSTALWDALMAVDRLTRLSDPGDSGSGKKQV